jgi:hypothetical protein
MAHLHWQAVEMKPMNSQAMMRGFAKQINPVMQFGKKPMAAAISTIYFQ